jgi:NAD(P)-dependent dehydrogenase (short-subunit alcohol dehydrogenase family)
MPANNAGVFDIAPLGTITTEHFHRLFDINVLGVILATQEALKYFNPAGGSWVTRETTEKGKQCEPISQALHAGGRRHRVH